MPQLARRMRQFILSLNFLCYCISACYAPGLTVHLYLQPTKWVHQQVDGEFWMGSQLFGSTFCTESRMSTLPLLGSGLAIDSVNPVWQGSNQELVVTVISIAFVFSLVNYVMDRWSMPVDLTLNKMSTYADCLCMLLDGAGFLCCQCFGTCFQEVFSKTGLFKRL